MLRVMYWMFVIGSLGFPFVVEFNKILGGENREISMIVGLIVNFALLVLFIWIGKKFVNKKKVENE